MGYDLNTLREKKARLVIGLMSGTSADGIDAVLTQISGCALDIKVIQRCFLFAPFAPEVRQRVLEVAQGQAGGSAQICRLNALLGQLYAKACLNLCEKAGILPQTVDLVGNHGQTIWHMPQEEAYLGCQVRGTLQIGEDAIIAQALGCPVIGDFRVRDMAAGGQGAPLVPYTEYLLYRQKDMTVALQNIGGIGNVTILPQNGTLSQITAFDTGPGNMVIDALVHLYTNGAAAYDEGGALAAQGQVHPDLIAFMLDDPYLLKQPPKTTGRETYGADYVGRLLECAKAKDIPLLDVIATATRFTAQSIALGISRFSPAWPGRLIVGGGGSRNHTLMKHLAGCLKGCQVMDNEALGFDSDAKEAVAFAILANEALFGLTNNVPGVTGASQAVVMGKLSL